jgi:hypothetical protein
MLHQVYLRKGMVIVPTTGRVENRGPYRDIEPVAVVPASDAEAIRSALRAAIARGNPPTLRYPRGAYPQPVVVKHAGVKSWGAFAREASPPWNIKETDGNYQIIGHRKHPTGWIEDPEQTIKFPHGSSSDQVIERMIAILQDAAAQPSS